jgi:hypothetical protein
MQRNRIDTRQSGCARTEAPPFSSHGKLWSGRPRRADLSPRATRFAILLLTVLAGCAARAPHPDAAQTRTPAKLAERTVKQLVSVWEAQLDRYISQEGAGDPAVLLQTRALHSRDVLRPARITFDALDVDAGVPSRDGWDVEGLLIGKQSGTHHWYVFLVGIVSRGGYRPSAIQDIRLVALSARGGRLSWAMSPPDRDAVQRYWATFRGSAVIRFPGETDEFILNLDEDRAWVQEVRSGATWSLPRSADSFLASGS